MIAGIIEIKEFSLVAFEAAKEMSKQLSTEIPVMTENDFRKIIASDNTHLFFLYTGEAIAGMLTLAVYHTPSGSKAWIEDVVINEAYRGNGFGRLLTQHAIDFVRSAGINILMLTSSPSRIAANKLYQSIGFEQKVTNVYRMKTG